LRAFDKADFYTDLPRSDSGPLGIQSSVHSALILKVNQKHANVDVSLNFA